MTITYNDLYLNTRQVLRADGSPAATLEAREIVCFAGGKSREELIRDGRLYVPPAIERRTAELLSRRLAGEPVAYLIGEWEFYGLSLDVSEAVLIPRVDTEVLAGETIDYIGDKDARVLDLCAGSGCVGLAVAVNCPNAQVVLGELSEAAVRICRQNIRRCDLASRVTVEPLDALERPPRDIGEFDCIVCNPPYIPTGDIASLDPSVRDFEPHLALDGGADGCAFFQAVSSLWRTVLRPGGRLCFEVGIGQADAVLRVMRQNGFGDINVISDTAKIPRVVYGTLWEGNI